jgi:RHS repeat-associated protein
MPLLCTQQYSIVALTSSTSSVLERYAYSAYGLPSFFDGSCSSLHTSNFAIRTLFTGREWDNDIQQYHYRARMYDPSLGRFSGKDPIRYRGFKWNLQYAHIDGRVAQCHFLLLATWRREEFDPQIASTLVLATVGGAVCYNRPSWNNYQHHTTTFFTSLCRICPMHATCLRLSSVELHWLS